jgi:hypothetical protein
MMGWMAPLWHLSAKLLSDRNSSEWEPSMGEVTTIGLYLAKHVFQVHGVEDEGATVLRTLTGRQPYGATTYFQTAANFIRGVANNFSRGGGRNREVAKVIKCISRNSI